MCLPRHEEVQQYVASSAAGNSDLDYDSGSAYTEASVVVELVGMVVVVAGYLGYSSMRSLDNFSILDYNCWRMHCLSAHRTPSN